LFLTKAALLPGYTETSSSVLRFPLLIAVQHLYHSRVCHLCFHSDWIAPPQNITHCVYWHIPNPSSLCCWDSLPAIEYLTLVLLAIQPYISLVSLLFVNLCIFFCHSAYRLILDGILCW
jgi:hypothetical protein